MRFDIVTLFPELFAAHLEHGVTRRAFAGGAVQVQLWPLREHATDTYRRVDDRPFGGGPGMVIRADVLAEAIDAVVPADDPRPRFLLSPRGRVFDQALARELANGPGAVFVCGRFEGVDERVIEARGLTELSIGDYVLSGGEVAAQVALDAIIRLLPGVMGGEGSDIEESHENGLLEYPHYTRPRDFEGRGIPEVLTSGNHASIAQWRRAEAEKLTKARRPDLFARKFPPEG